MPPKAAKEVVPAIVVIVPDTYPCSPARSGQPGARGNIAKCTVPIVLVEVRCRGILGSIGFSKTNSIGQVNIEPTIVVVIKEGEATSLPLDDVLLTLNTTPNVWRPSVPPIGRRLQKLQQVQWLNPEVTLHGSPSFRSTATKAWRAFPGVDFPKGLPTSSRSCGGTHSSQITTNACIQWN